MCCVKLWVSAYFLLKDNPIQNSRLFTIKRMSRVVSKDRVKKIFDRLYTSKLRYGLQLLGNVRLKNEDPKDGILKSLQITQNKAAQFLNWNKLQDHVPTKQTFDDLDLLSVTQLNAQIKIREVWKSLIDYMHPVQWEKRSADQSSGCTLRSALSKAL